MRLFLIPVSTRRTLLYAQRLNVTTSEGKAGIVDKVAARAAKTWATWEKKEKGWQKTLVGYGNQAFRRIPFEEWGLKSVPPLSTRRRKEELEGPGKVELVFPGSLIKTDDAETLAKKLATERQALHRQRMTWCLVAAPFTLPFALIPVIPNIPFFYLVYRAWSNWKAIAGGKHVQWLIENKLLESKPSESLDKLYTNSPKKEPEGFETPLFSHDEIRGFSETLDMPDLETELDRAVWQIETAQQKERDAKKANEPKTEEKSDEKKD